MLWTTVRRGKRRETLQSQVCERNGARAAFCCVKGREELKRNIGRDLQFTRINGTLVGGLVGLAIYSATRWLSLE